MTGAHKFRASQKNWGYVFSDIADTRRRGQNIRIGIVTRI